MNYLYEVLSIIMNRCYGICGNYGIAIVLFTLMSKLILIPVSVWTHLNSIKMVKLQPDINFLKARYYGQREIIEEEQAKLYKREKYSPLASTIPLIIQLILLMGVVGVINLGIADPSIDMNIAGLNLALIPSEEGISLLFSPILAGLSSLLLCITQNLSNVLQSEQSKANKYGMMVFSVGLSLYLGWFVPLGTAWYWILSNLFSILQMYILNALIPPSAYVDYERLAESRKELSKLSEIGVDKAKSVSKEDKKREKADYKRFFSVVNKHLVFYSESNGFYKYYKGIIEYILNNTNITIHYITSDPRDNIFAMEKENSQIRAYYIGENRLITLMMKMDADIVVLTMPDLDNFHIKRSYIRNDIEYIFVNHAVGSTNLTLRKGATDHFDTVFLVGKHQRAEEEQLSKLYGLPERRLVDVGYPLIDEMRSVYRAKDHPVHEKKKILIAPSWQKDNIIDTCLEEILDALKDKDYEIAVRPHPQEVRLKSSYMEVLRQKYEPLGIEIQTDFSSNNPVMESDILITDWSDISWEFAFTTLHPVLFINTPMKVMNPDWQKIEEPPINIALRDRIGISVDTDNIRTLPEKIAYLVSHSEDYRNTIDILAGEYLYNIDSSSEIGGKYIVESIKNKIDKKRSKQK